MPAGRGLVRFPLLAEDGFHCLVSITPDIISEGFDVPGCVDEFEDTGDDESIICRGVVVGWDGGELLEDKVI